MEVFELEEARQCYEECIKLREEHFKNKNHILIEKILSRLYENYARERGNYV